MEALVWETAEELDMKLAQRVRNIRRRRKISQEELSRMSGVSYGSVKRFEATGKISLLSLTKLAMALDMADELRELFTQVPYRNIQEVIDERKRNTTSFIWKSSWKSGVNGRKKDCI